MESSDDDDKFLYGSDNEDPNVTSQKLKKPDQIQKQGSTKDQENDVASDDDDVDDEVDDNMNSDENDDDDDDDDDQYNVEFVISAGPITTRLDSRSKNILGGQATTTTASTINSGETISVVPTETNDTMTNATDTGSATGKIKSEDGVSVDKDGKPINIEAGSIDLDKDGLFDGRPITEIDPEVLKEKPWRQPGANLSDYFNFGFNESTWTEYLHRQERLRDEYSPRRILMGLLTLQQQGKLDIKTNFDPNANNNKSNNNNNNNINKNVLNPNINNTPVMNTQLPPPPAGMPQGFPAMPMFGGFPPFGMPGMMPLNPQQNMNNNNMNSNNLNNNNNNNNNNQRKQQR